MPAPGTRQSENLANKTNGCGDVSWNAGVVAPWVALHGDAQPFPLPSPEPVLPYIAGTGSAVTDLIFSIAKREVTFFSGTAPISFL